ncbi:MAG TPA: prolyl oligopeptidase family serine peptidase, partial [Kofleriaceae bacterium]|nr:prolyl oligopeptidase family serine peptidase [Kofleriaceae bacterium]
MRSARSIVPLLLIALLVTSRRDAAAGARPGAVRRATDAVRGRISRARVRRALSYPHAPRGNTVERRFGRRVADPYRWLEDPGSNDTRTWVDQQNQLSRGFLDALPARAALASRLSAVAPRSTRRGDRTRVGNRFTFSRTTAGKTTVLVHGLRGGRPRVLLDAAELPAGYDLASTSFSPDGKYLTYGLRAHGSDWIEWKVRDVATGRDAVDHLQSTKFYGVSWAADGSGFFYSRFPEPKPGRALVDRNAGHRIFFHRIHTPQYEDVVVVDRPARSAWRLGASVVGGGRYLLVTTSKGSGAGARVELRDLQDAKAGPQELIDLGDGELTFLRSEPDAAAGPRPILWFHTNKGAARGRIIRIDPNARPGQRTDTIVAEANEVLHDVTVMKDGIAAVYLADAVPILRVFDRQGALRREVPLPGVGEVTDVRAGSRPNQILYTFSSFLTPPTEYRTNVATGRTTVVRGPGTLPFDPADFEVRREVVTSKDGTKVPMVLVHKKGIALDGSNPTYLYGYGGFHNARIPAYSSALIPWLEAGGVYAAPALRGGGEYGEEWHDAGTRTRKQNVFDDFIASAEHLIATGVTSADKLAVGGGSNGGLLVGAAITQRPELFAAAVPQVGVLDSLRYDEFTVGDGWLRDYGSPDRADTFEALVRYSPVHNVKPGTRYPATLIVTGDHDDRVVPAHSYKFAAALQHAQGGSAPILLQVSRNAGHGSSGSSADRWAF